MIRDALTVLKHRRFAEILETAYDKFHAATLSVPGIILTNHTRVTIN